MRKSIGLMLLFIAMALVMSLTNNGENKKDTTQKVVEKTKDHFGEVDRIIQEAKNQALHEAEDNVKADSK